MVGGNFSVIVKETKGGSGKNIASLLCTMCFHSQGGSKDQNTCRLAQKEILACFSREANSSSYYHFFGPLSDLTKISLRVKRHTP